jgi:hypothetical protein
MKMEICFAKQELSWLFIICGCTDSVHSAAVRWHFLHFIAWMSDMY